MRKSPKDRAHEEKHVDHLKIKLERELPKDDIENIDLEPQLEHKKHIVDAIESAKLHKDRRREKQEAIKFEEEASGEYINYHNIVTE